MSIEENNNEELQNSVIPSFDPQSFLDDDNEISLGNTINQNQEIQQTGGSGGEQEEEEEQQQEKRSISLDEDFLNIRDEDFEEEFNPEDYSVLSKTLGVEINSKEDLENIQAKIKGESPAPQKNENTNYNFSDEENKQFENLTNALEGAKNATPEDLMKWHLKRINTNADYENNPEELEYHIDSLKETGLFNSQEKEVRQKLISEITGQKEGLINQSRQKQEQQSIAVNRELEQEIKKYKDGFHGISLEPKDLFETFKSIKNGSVFEEIESSQANVAEMSLLWKNKELFYKAFENPDTSAGIKKMMSELQNSKARPAAGNNTLKNPLVFDPEAFLNSEDIKVVGNGN